MICSDLQRRFEQAVGLDRLGRPGAGDAAEPRRTAADGAQPAPGPHCRGVTIHEVHRQTGRITMKLRLEDLVTSVATDLMGVTRPTLQHASKHLLHRLVDYFEVDLSFLRRNDHDLGATVLVAEWPPRPDIPEPDPLGVILFAGADPTFAALENLSSVLTTRPSDDDEYQDRVRQGSGIQGVSLATVPLLSSARHHRHARFHQVRRPGMAARRDQRAAGGGRAAGSTAGAGRRRGAAALPGLPRRADRTGHPPRIDRPPRRTAQAGQPRARSRVIFIDVDRLKALNSFLGHAAGDQFLQTLAHRLTGCVDRRIICWPGSVATNSSR